MDFSKLDIDSFGEYRIQPNFVKATGSTRGRHDVAMVTHCTVNHLHYLLDLVQHWRGSISIGMCSTYYSADTLNRKMIFCYE